MAERVFSTAYASKFAGISVWAPLAAASVLGVWGVLSNKLGLTAFSAAMSAMAVWNWPFLDPGRVVLRLSDAGADIDGLGRIVWESIDSAEFVTQRLAKANNVYIRLELSEPVSVAAIAMPAMTRPPWHRTLVQLKGDKVIILPTSRLLDSPQDIAQAFQHFLGQKFRVVQP